MNDRPDIERVTGLSPRFVWRMTAVIWATLGCVQIASYAFHFTPEPLPFICVVTGGFLPLILAGVWFWCGSRAVSLEPWYHVQVILGFVAIIGTTALDVNDHSADAVYPLMPMIIAVMVFPIQRALPYVFIAAAGAAAFVLTGNDANAEQRAIVVAIMTLAIGAIMSVVHSQIQRAVRRNHELAEVDELTGTANQRRLMQRLDEEFARESRDSEVQLALLTIDLDDFKQVNDDHGHTLGDRVLIESAHAIQRQLEPSDLLVRRGGDEFSVLALDHPERDIELLRGRIREAIVERRSALCPDIPPGASIGLVRPDADETVADFLARGDEALHIEKRRWYGKRETAQPRSGDAVGSLHSIGRDDAAVDAPAEMDAPQRRTTVGASHAQTIERVAWQMLAAYLFVLGALVPVLGLTGHGGGLMQPTVVAICYAAVVAAATCLWLARIETKRFLLDAALAMSVVLTVLLVADGAVARNALVELLICPAMIACYAAHRRTAFGYVAVCMAAYVFFLTTLDYDLTVIRAVQTVAVVVLLGFAIPRGLERARWASDENERLSGVDPLTGLANLRRLRLRLADELARCATVGGVVTLFAVDLDDFKAVNDKHSHTVGDEVLRAVADVLAREIRPYDLAARRGGDEFMIVMPHGGEIDLELVAKRIGAAIASARYRLCSDVLPTASIGYVTSLRNEDPGELIARADARERTAKLNAHGKRHLRAVA